MIIAVQGSKSFDDYDVFMRAMGVALSGLGKDTQIDIWSVGPHKVNNFAIAFSNLSENYMKGLGKRIKTTKVASDFVTKHADSIDYFAYLCRPHEQASTLTSILELDNVEVGIFRY